MSILIKGMEMPKSCFECFALDDSGDYPFCLITQETRGYTFHRREVRMTKCPLMEVPPHGRLIDADAFTKDECNSCDGACEAIQCDCLNCKKDCRCEFMKDLADAPIIIEAEDGT